MLGLTSILQKAGGYIIPVDSSDSVNSILTFEVPAGSRIMCSNCTIENEASLISEGKLTKVENGYFVESHISNLKITRSISDKSPLTILKPREILYVDYIKTDDGALFNLPLGARVNGNICSVTGENIIPEKSNYLIEL